MFAKMATERVELVFLAHLSVEMGHCISVLRDSAAITNPAAIGSTESNKYAIG